MKNVKCSLIISIIFTFFTINSINESCLKENNWLLLVSVLFIVGIYFVVLYMFLYLRDTLTLKDNLSIFNCIHARLPVNSYSIKYFIFFTYLIMYLFAFFAFYPAIFGYDGPVQIIQFFTHTVSAHHPLIHTLFLGFCFKIGYFLFKDYNYGLALYALIQLITMTLIFTYITLWIHNRKVPHILQVGSFLFFALNPITIVLNVNTTKDTLFAGFFVLVYIKLIDLMELIVKNDSAKISRKFCIKFLFLTIGMCLFRNQGYYLLAFVSIFSFVLFWKTNKTVPMLLILCTIIGYFFMGPFLNIINVPMGDAKEMFSIPMQQLASVWNANESTPGLLTSEEKEKLETLIPQESLLKYEPTSADNVKIGFKTDVFKNNLKDYVKLYISLGLRYPKSYMQTFTNMVSSFWALDQYGSARPLLYSNSFDSPDVNICKIESRSKFAFYKYIISFITGEIKYFPIVRTIYSQAFPIWLIVIAFVLSIFERKKAILGSLPLLIGQWGIMLLSPVALVRYAYPLILCVPILIIQILEKRGIENGKK